MTLSMTIGVIGTSLKKNEQRVPIYPEHLSWITPELRRHLVFERGYGLHFGFSDRHFTDHGSHVATRDDIFSSCDVLILPKPVRTDIEHMKPQQTLWGWPHCVQQKSITQAAIDRRITIIAWEAMHHWSASGERLMHIFYKNNELAGYAAVLHTLQLLGIDGLYGPRRKVAILGYGSVSRGAIYALQGRGFNNIHVYSRRPVHLIADQNPDVYYTNMIIHKDGQILCRRQNGTTCHLISELADADIICNCVLQDTDHPMVFVTEPDLAQLKPRTVIIDISCDEGMGFYFAKPTTFANPIFSVGNNITYYSVDHTPSYLWNSASREISRALLPFLADIATGSAAFDNNKTLCRAIELRDGVIKNPKILSFQKRAPQYPHPLD